MIYDFIDALVNAIREEESYLAYQDALTQLKQETVKDLLSSYQRACEKQAELAQYAPYIDLHEIDETAAKLKKQVDALPEVIAYQEALKHLNCDLDEVSQLVFGGIADDLYIGRVEKRYARYRRKI